MTLFDTEPRSWEEVRDEALDCQACPLWEPAGDTVFGEGPVPARIMLVGEQPGDQEDRQTRPFVGPAGKILDDALEEAELERSDLYVTNAVKHFKFELRGKRRIHQTPTAGEAKACHPWLRIRARPRASPSCSCCSGATAAKAVLGSKFRLTQHRGEAVESDAARVVTATIHLSAMLQDNNVLCSHHLVSIQVLLVNHRRR